jgi:cytochrome P450
VLPEETDPPDWQGYRRFFNPILSPGSVNELRPLISKWTTYFIDQIIESGRGDLIYDIASPIPASVTLEWLAFPPEDWKQFAEPIHDVSGSAPGTERHDRAREGFGSILDSIKAIVDDRKISPRDDIVSRLVRYEIDGRNPTDADLHSMILMTLEGGIDTTTSLTGSALVHLDRTPEDRQLLMEHPELLVQATEEFLRVYPPAMAHARTVRSDVEIHGVSMKKGDRVLVSW